MNKARFVWNKIRGSRVEGVSEATRYIARSKLDQEREGKELRRLFNDDRDDLSHREADRWLSAGGTRLNKEDILHYVLSLQEPEDYERLGEDDKERNEHLREAVRHALLRAEREMSVDRLQWVAGIHLNTDNPHIHVIISRLALDRETGNLRRFGKLPRAVVPHNDRRPDGTRTFVRGTLLDAFSDNVDARQLERARQIEAERHRHNNARASRERNESRPPARNYDSTWRDRYLLGLSMVARGEVERLGAQIERLKAHGQSRHQGNHQRRKVENHHDDGHLSINENRASVLEKLERRLVEARQAHARLQPDVQSIREGRKLTGEPLPTPLLSVGQLKKLQDHAIETQDARSFRTMEKIRSALAAERREPPRTPREWARHAAHLRLAQVELQARTKRTDDHLSTRHLAPVAVRGTLWSLARVDRTIEETRKETSVAHVGIAGKFPSTQQRVAEKLAGLQRIRSEVIEAVRGRGVELEAEKSRAAEMVETLSDVYRSEEIKRLARGEKMPEALFTRRELGRIESQALYLKDAALLREAGELERVYEARLPPEKRSTIEHRAARALAREIVAEVTWQEARARTIEHDYGRRRAPVAIENSQGDIITATLGNRKVRSLGSLIKHVADEINAPLSRAEIERAASVERERFMRNLTNAREYYETAHAIADEFRNDLKREGKEVPAPTFTPKEQRSLNLHETQSQPPLAKTEQPREVSHSQFPADSHSTHIFSR